MWQASASRHMYNLRGIIEQHLGVSMALFRAETKARIRRRIGYLIFGSEFVYGPIAARDSTTFTLLQAARMPDDYFVGRVAHFLGTGESLSVSDSENGTGMMTVLPAFNVLPDVASEVEVWSDSVGITEVDEAINQAILDAADQSPVKVRATLDEFAVDRKSVELPETWSHLSGLYWEYGNTIERPKYVTDRGRFQPYSTYPVEYTLEGHTIHLPYALPSSVADIHVVGYRLPQELVEDSDECEVRSDYVVYKAASLLQMEDLGTVSSDPEAHSQRGSGWLSHAEMVRSKMKPRWDSNTVALE